ncbi:uncharacterized protein [Macrobrachium rosenbergii]|uniref:uncharacterized protein n=1 Tax=Macrobrachium rosenbergii TaxID=79674 RepID=UPI0034D68575
MTGVIDSGDIDAITSLRDSIEDNLKKVLALDEQILDSVTVEEMSDEMEKLLKLISGFKFEAANYPQAVALLLSTYGKRDEIKHVLVRRLLEMESPAANSESLQTFRANFECSIRSLESEKLELNELYTILLYTKLPKSVSETVKRRCGDNWLVLDTFKKYLEEEISNLRSFVSTDVNKSETLSSISTFTVNQSQAVRPKNKGNVNKSSHQQSRRCALCDNEHWWTQCKTYTTRNERLNRIRALQLCFVCASKKHFSVDCDKPSCNKGCKMRHHRILCDRDQTGKQSKNKPSGVQVGTLSVNEQDKTNKLGKRSILPTATIPLKGKKGRLVRLRGLLDTCAERTFIKRSALERLQYRSKGVEKIALRGYLTSKPVHEYEMISIAIPHKGELIIMDRIVVDELPEYAKKFDVKRSLRSLCKTKISLADKDFDLPVENQSTIELLIGVDNVYNILHPGFKRVRNLILLPTIFGYVVTGTCSAPPTRETHVTVLKLAVQTEEIEATNNENPKTDLDALWSLDRLGIDCSELQEQDQRVLKDFESTITYSEIDKQYVVALPWKTNRFRLMTNFGLAMSRLRQQSIKFQKDVDYLEHYQKILQEQEDRGFIERVIYNKSDVDCHYLAHHGVLRDSATTPIRIVFDCSSKQGDVVLVHDEGPRNKWKLGQVIQVHVGSDNVVRVATLKTSHGQIMRPIVKLYPLELWQEVETPDPAKIPEHTQPQCHFVEKVPHHLTVTLTLRDNSSLPKYVQLTCIDALTHLNHGNRES